MSAPNLLLPRSLRSSMVWLTSSWRIVTACSAHPLEREMENSLDSLPQEVISITWIQESHYGVPHIGRSGPIPVPGGFFIPILPH
ncbi:hypothetical protein R3P38DRAFT_1328982 [Favolaschia claudopus]|uniref:Secreted protein n=1 Tax=Favolaschia claudopus TaxID=2862362 RepID=A0AAW0ATW7_9AGAR